MQSAVRGALIAPRAATDSQREALQATKRIEQDRQVRQQARRRERAGRFVPVSPMPIPLAAGRH